MTFKCELGSLSLKTKKRIPLTRVRFPITTQMERSEWRNENTTSH